LNSPEANKKAKHLKPVANTRPRPHCIAICIAKQS